MRVFIVILFLFSACGQRSNSSYHLLKEDSIVADSTLTVNDLLRDTSNSLKPIIVKSEEERIKEVFTEFKRLYYELMKFKNTDEFKKYGFAVNSPYHKWLDYVEKLQQNPDSKLLLKKRVVAAELYTLGTSYVGSKGQETELTKFFNKTFREAMESGN